VSRGQHHVLVTGIINPSCGEKGRLVLCEVHVDGGGDNTVVPGILPVTPVERGAAAQVVDDALEQTDLAPLWNASS
jgi:hypothetical protein